jgi:hypothetical protein
LVAADHEASWINLHHCSKKGKTLQTKASIAQMTKQNHVCRRWIRSTEKEKFLIDLQSTHMGTHVLISLLGFYHTEETPN